MDKIEIRLQVPADWNELRKTKGQTWRDIIKLGLNNLTEEGAPQDPVVAAHLKASVESIMKAYNLLKKGNTP